MTRARLLVHGLLSGLLFGALAGVVDACTTNTTYLDRTFLGVTVVAWVACGLLAGLVLGSVAAGLASADGRGPRAPARLAAAITTKAMLAPLWFLLLVHVNVVYLASDTSPAALLFDALSALGAIALAIPLHRRLAAAYERGGALRGALASIAGPPVLVLLCVGVAMLAWRGGRGSEGPPDRDAPENAPNVLLVLIDTLRRDHLSMEGYGRPTSPALDELVQDGARFSDFTSQSCYTKPAVASLLTSRYPSGHRVGHLRTVLSEEHVTLAEIFHQAGWRTAKFVSNPIVGPEFGFAQGTELFHMLPSELTPQTKLGYAIFRLTQSGRRVPIATQLAWALRALEHAVTGRGGAEILHLDASDVLSAFDSWRGTLHDDPWFAYLHFMEPHAPYEPPEPDATRFASADEPMRANHPQNARMFLPFSEGDRVPEAARAGLVRAYDAEIAGLDRLLGEFLERTRASSSRPLLLAITSDHGEEFWEHRGWGHGHSLHGELLGVPFLLAGEGVPSGVRIDAPAQLVDVAPTLLELARVDPPDGLVGRSLVPLLRLAEAGQPMPTTERERFSEIVYGGSHWARALEVGRWKLIVSRLGDERSAQLYDLEVDPVETNDLAAELPGRVEGMKARIDALVAAAVSGASPETTAEFDPVTLERLRGLGYVGD